MFLRVGVSNSYFLGLAVLRMRVKDSYVWGLVIFMFKGLDFLRLEV